MSGAKNYYGAIGTVVGAVVGSFVGAPTVGASIGSALGGAAQSHMADAPKMPELPSPIPMPDPKAIGDANKNSIVQQYFQRGRASTILTNPSGNNKLGG